VVAVDFWYNGTRPAVRGRQFSLDARPYAEPTILVGRNGAGKTLAAAIFQRTRAMFLGDSADPQAAFVEWMDFVRSLGIDELGFSIEVPLYSIDLDDQENTRVPYFFLFWESDDDAYCEFEYPEFARKFMTGDEVVRSTGPYALFDVVACGQLFVTFSGLQGKDPILGSSFELVTTAYCLLKDTEIPEQLYLEYECAVRSNQRILVNNQVVDLDNFDTPLSIISTSFDSDLSLIQQDCVSTFREVLNGLSEKASLEIPHNWEPLIFTHKNSVDLDPIRDLISRKFPLLFSVETTRTWGGPEEAQLDRTVLQAIHNLRAKLAQKYRLLNLDLADDFFDSLVENHVASRANRDFYSDSVVDLDCIIEQSIPVFKSQSIVMGDVPGRSISQEHRNRVIKRISLPAYGNHPKIGEWFGYAQEIIDSILKSEFYRDYRQAALDGEHRNVWNCSNDVEDFLHTYLLCAFLKNLLNNVPQLLSTRLMDGLIDFVWNEDDHRNQDVLTLIKLFGVNNPEHIPSGYRQLLTLVLSVANAVQPKEQPSSVVLFVDEPELSLHIDWQVGLIGMLMKLLRDLKSDSGLLVATHSPDIIQNHLDAVVDFSSIDQFEGE
jgi:hypothetical protein